MKPAEIRRQRLLVSLGAAMLALLVLAPAGLFGYQASADGIRSKTINDADWHLDQAMLMQRTGDVSPPFNTWIVNTVDGWGSPVGETSTDPPLVSLAQPAMGGEAIREFDFDGQWLASARWIGGNEVMLTVVGRAEQEDRLRSAQRRWLASILGLSALVGLFVWLVSRRIQGPVERAHDVNRDFIADAAHELRTPLSIIQASAGHALSRDRSPAEYQESLGEILTATERAGASVGELLEFARLEAGQATPRLAPLRLDLLTEEVAASIRVDDTVIEARPGEAVVVDADYNLIRQMLDNLTRNAAARANKVTLSAELEATNAKIDIVDDGPGFDPGIIDHVFERFRRGDRSGNVGLGMAIARTIVELHGGSCEARNGREGKGEELSSNVGAVVTIRLPVTHR